MYTRIIFTSTKCLACLAYTVQGSGLRFGGPETNLTRTLNIKCKLFLAQAKLENGGAHETKRVAIIYTCYTNRN